VNEAPSPQRVRWCARSTAAVGSRACNIVLSAEPASTSPR
jgi:hypothetical protein